MISFLGGLGCEHNVFQRRGELSWTEAGQEDRQVTEETKRLCKLINDHVCTYIIHLINNEVKMWSLCCWYWTWDKDIRKPFPLCTTVNLAGTSCWRTKMSLQWQGEEERGDQIGDLSAINGKFRLDIFLKIKICLSWYYSRGPASQVGYQRERDVTGKTCIPVFNSSFLNSSCQAWLGAQGWMELTIQTNWWESCERYENQMKSCYILNVWGYPHWYLQMGHWLVLLRMSTDARIHFVVMVSSLISYVRRLCDICTNKNSIWTWEI